MSMVLLACSTEGKSLGGNVLSAFFSPCLCSCIYMRSHLTLVSYDDISTNWLPWEKIKLN